MRETHRKRQRTVHEQASWATRVCRGVPGDPIETWSNSDRIVYCCLRSTNPSQQLAVPELPAVGIVGRLQLAKVIGV